MIRTRNEADRLRLTLVSLGQQTVLAEIVVVDDGSTDDTGAVVAAASADLAIRLVRHPQALGRAQASNAGAEVATGNILIFLDGDTLAAPSVVADHLAAHRRGAGLIARGETWNLRCTRWLRDPDSGRPQPEFADRVAGLSAAERDACRVTSEQVRNDFAAIVRRAQPGCYPGHGPRRLHELEMDALRHHPGCSVLWAAASGSNMSVERSRFLAAGGFDPRLDINEHRELALRLCEQGGRMVAVEGARTYHLTHRVGWRDPLQERDWLDIMREAHPQPAVRLLPLFWAGLSHGGVGDIGSLPDLEARAAREASA